MAKITLEIPEDLMQQLEDLGDRLPELLRLSLQQPAVPTSIYRYILNFLTSNPTPDEIVAFHPTPEMIERLQTLLRRSKTEKLTQAELDEFERIEHLIIMLKSGNLPYLNLTHLIYSCPNS